MSVAEEAGFVSKLSHALRTPLAIVVGYAELLQQRDDPETRAEAPARIAEAADRLSGALDDVMTAFAIEVGELPWEPTGVELGEVVKAAVADAAKRHRDCSFSLEPASARVDGDPYYLGQILRALLDDACARGSSGDVRVGVNAADDATGITVAFAGGAVSAEALDAPWRAASGTLALYSARRLAELHGGTIVASGSAFTFTIPAR